MVCLPELPIKRYDTMTISCSLMFYGLLQLDMHQSDSKMLYIYFQEGSFFQIVSVFAMMFGGCISNSVQVSGVKFLKGIRHYDL